MLYVYLDRKKRRRKFLTTTFFRALGYGTDADILKLFYDIEELSVKEAEKLEDIQNKVLVEDAVDHGQKHCRGARFRAAFQSGRETDRRTRREQDPRGGYDR